MTNKPNSHYHTNVHYIQRKILSILLYADTLPYTSLRPKGIESNHFAYHLKQLLRTGLIVKNSKGYCLAPTGLAYIDRMSQNKMVDRLQPHIVTAIDITDNHGRTLLFKRNFQPFIHTFGLILGKTHYEETVAQAAARELQEKSGLAGIQLTHRGIVYVQAVQQNVTISKVLYHVFQGNVEEALPTIAPNNRGSCHWLDSKTLNKTQTMPGFFEIKRLLATKKAELFFDEFTISI